MPKVPIAKPSASMAVAVLALVLAASSSAIAASGLMNGDRVIMPHSLSGNRLRRHTITAAQINLRKLGQVPSSRHANSAGDADSATHASTAVSATTAGTAANALSLGGVPAAGYTRDDCASITGQVKGFAVVPASPTFSGSFVRLSTAFNCSGQPVQAKRIGPGAYEVRFPGSPVTIAVGNILLSGLQAGTHPGSVNFARLANGDFDVVVANGNGNGLDEPFSVLTP